jgi:predicted deacylase
MLHLVCYFLILVFHSPLSQAKQVDPAYNKDRVDFKRICSEKLASELKNTKNYCHSHKIKSSYDSDLSVESGYFSKNNLNLIVLSTGVHGIETPAGFEIEKLFLKKYLTLFLTKGFDVYILQSVDPYGYKYSRRTDEENVNLNRNFATDVALYQNINSDYMLLRSVFEPSGKIKSVFIEKLLLKVKLIWNYALSGFNKRKINEAMNSGQFQFPQGLNYGGRHSQIQTQILKTELTPLINKHPGNVIYLDFHTGLGDFGVLHIIDDGDNEAKASEIQNHFRTVVSETSQIKYTSTSDPGFYKTKGDVLGFIKRLAPDRRNILPLTMEFGTMGLGLSSQLESAARMILENQAHFFGCEKPISCIQVTGEFRELFNPHQNLWHDVVLKTSDQVFDLLIKNW